MSLVYYLLLLSATLVVIMIILSMNLNCKRVHMIYLDDRDYFSPGPSYGIGDTMLMSTPFDFQSYVAPTMFAEYK